MAVVRLPTVPVALNRRRATGLSPARPSKVARDRLARLMPPVVFAGLSIVVAAHLLSQDGGRGLGADANTYWRGTQAFLAGGDPWSTRGDGSWFSGWPPTVLVLAPIVALVPEPAFRILAVVTSALAAWWVVRLLGMPWWWLLFPPIVASTIVGNPNVPAFALALTPGLRALGPVLKPIPIVGMAGERRWRALGTLAVGAAISITVLPDLWYGWARSLPAQGQRIAGDLGTVDPVWLVLGAAVLLLVAQRDIRSAAWLLVPLLWPTGTYGYLMLGTAARARLWWLAAVPLPVAVIAGALPISSPSRLPLDALDQERRLRAQLAADTSLSRTARAPSS